MACVGGLHDGQRIGRVLCRCLPQALALRGIGQRAQHDSVQAHAHLLGIFAELKFESTGPFQAGGDAGRNSGQDELHSSVVRSDDQGGLQTAGDCALTNRRRSLSKVVNFLNELKSVVDTVVKFS